MYDKDVKAAEVNGRESYIMVGECGVVYIEYHVPRGEGDKHYIDVKYENGRQKRIFDICELEFM